MSHLRLLVVWLLFATLPLQGFAARTLLFCMQPAGAGHQQAAPAGHDHHGESGHAFAATVPEPDTAATASHECGACAACCHAVAAVQSDPQGAGSLPRAVASAEPQLRIASRTSRLPDKPPRG